jgi:hypothetical protein
MRRVPVWLLLASACGGSGAHTTAPPPGDGSADATIEGGISASGRCTATSCPTGFICDLGFQPSLCVELVSGDCGPGSCPAGDVCVESSAGQGVCYPACDAGSTGCLHGGTCYATAEAGTAGVCEPACQGDIDCISGSCVDGVCQAASVPVEAGSVDARLDSRG